MALNTAFRLVTKAVGQLRSVYTGIAVDELANKLDGIGMGKLPLDLTAC